MKLREFRDRNSMFRLNVLCEHRDGTLLEIISWPYLKDEEKYGDQESPHNPVLVKARKPGDPTTVDTYRISQANPDLFGLVALCTRDNTTFVPVVCMNGTRLCIDCPTCEMSYFHSTELNQANQVTWEADRPLIFRKY